MDSFIFWKVTVSDILQFVGLIVTMWIAIVVQKKLTKNCYLKDYFINEIKDLRNEYRILFADIQSSKLNSKTIKDRVKIISLRIKTIEDYSTRYFSIESSNLKLLHSEFQQFITGTDDFNNQYKKITITFSDMTITKILEYQKDIVDELTLCVININNASKRFKWWFVRNKTL